MSAMSSMDVVVHVGIDMSKYKVDQFSELMEELKVMSNEWDDDKPGSGNDVKSYDEMLDNLERFVKRMSALNTKPKLREDDTYKDKLLDLVDELEMFAGKVFDHEDDWYYHSDWLKQSALDGIAARMRKALK